MNSHIRHEIPDRMTVHVPVVFVKRGGTKQIVVPDGAPLPQAQPIRVDNTLVKALARAFRWRRLLEHNSFGSIDELARAEGINPSYVSRILRLTLLAPKLVESVLDGCQPRAATLRKLMKPIPSDWSEQERILFKASKLKPL